MVPTVGATVSINASELVPSNKTPADSRAPLSAPTRFSTDPLAVAVSAENASLTSVAKMLPISDAVYPPISLLTTVLAV